VIPFFAFAPEVRKIHCTTNAIESVNAQVRKAVRIRNHFPSEGGRDQTYLAGVAHRAGALKKFADFLAGGQTPTGDPVRRPLRRDGMKWLVCRHGK